MAELAYSANSW